MRISNNPAMTQSSTSTARHHPQLLAVQHTTRVTSIVEGYDFGRARSSESTENTFTGKGGSSSIVTTRNTMSSPPRTAVSSSSSFAEEEEEARGVPVSPIKMPPTPPRDHGSPYRPGNFQSAHAQAQAQVVTPDHPRLLQPPSAFVRSQQPFLQPHQLQHQHQQMPMHTFLRPSPSSSSWRQKEEGHGGASIFRSSPMLQSQQYSEGCLSREHDSYYTIQRSPAFDDYSDSDEDDGTANENESHNHVENFISIFNMRAESW